MGRKLISRAFRDLEFIDLDDLSKGSVRIKQFSEISHDGEFEIEEKTFEDSLDPNQTLRTKRNGNITLVGCVEHFVYQHHDAGTKTKPFFELGHNYLIRGLFVDVDDDQVDTADQRAGYLR